MTTIPVKTEPTTPPLTQKRKKAKNDIPRPPKKIKKEETDTEEKKERKDKEKKEKDPFSVHLSVPVVKQYLSNYGCRRMSGDFKDEFRNQFNIFLRTIAINLTKNGRRDKTVTIDDVEDAFFEYYDAQDTTKESNYLPKNIICKTTTRLVGMPWEGNAVLAGEAQDRLWALANQWVHKKIKRAVGAQKICKKKTISKAFLDI